MSSVQPHRIVIFVVCRSSCLVNSKGDIYVIQNKVIWSHSRLRQAVDQADVKFKVFIIVQPRGIVPGGAGDAMADQLS